MTALANSLRRIWSARDRVPYLTGWGAPGPRMLAEEAGFAQWVLEASLELIAIARRTAPTIVVVTLNIFR